MAEQQRAYQPGYQPKQVRHHEWRTAENSAEQLVPVLKERAEKNPKLTLLDVGSGSGTIATSLAKYIPEGNVTATDLSDDIMKRAEQLAREAGITNVTFQQADAYHLPFPDESFDVVHTSQMLIHMDEPQNAIKELVRVAKKGGVISCREGDLPLMVYWPEIPAQQRFQKLAVTLHDLTAGKSTCGRQLVGLALKAGVKRDQIQASWHTWCYSSPEEREIISATFSDRLKAGSWGKGMLEHGLATEAEIQEMIDAWQQWKESEDANMAIPSCAILIFK